MRHLSLYHYPSCFFCRRVHKAMQKLGIEIELRDIRRDSRFKQELVEARGRRTVPVLRIEEEDGSVHWMGESRVIVRYLQFLQS